MSKTSLLHCYVKKMTTESVWVRRNDGKNFDHFPDNDDVEFSRMKPRDFDILGVIGKGSFGSVYLARQKKTKKIFAMKVLGKEHIKMRNEQQHIMAERNVLKSNVNHPFLVSLHFSFQTKDKLYFILDYVNGGEVKFK